MSAGKNDKILDKDCKSLVVEAIDTVGNQRVTQTHYYSGEPYLDPELFKNYRDFYTYDIFKKTESPFLKLEMDLDGYVVTYTALKIERKKLDEKQFDLPQGFPFKEY